MDRVVFAIFAAFCSVVVLCRVDQRLNRRSPRARRRARVEGRLAGCHYRGFFTLALWRMGAMALAAVVRCVLVATVVFGCVNLHAADAAKQNVLFILADDLGWGDLACYGNKFVRTPNLDRLAAEGRLFTNFYVCGSVCSPSRCAFFTGTYPSRQKIHGHFAAPAQNTNRGMPQWLDPAVPNVAKVLKNAGYATAHVGKWHLTTETDEAPKITDYGFDFYGSGERGAEVNKKDPYYRANSTKLFVDETLKFIGDQKGKPF